MQLNQLMVSVDIEQLEKCNVPSPGTRSHRHGDLLHTTDDALVELALAQMRRLWGVSGFPTFQNEVRIILSIPQYNVGCGEVEETIDHLEAESPGRFSPATIATESLSPIASRAESAPVAS